MRITIKRRRGLLVASAALATLGLAAHANAQYAPYGATQPQTQYPAQSPYNPGAAQYGTASAQYGVAPQNGAGQYGAAPTQYTAPPVQSQSRSQYGASAAQQPLRPQYAAQGAYQGYAPYQAANPSSPYTVPHTAMAFQPGAVAPPTTTPTPGPESLPLTPPVESVPAGAMQGGAYVPQPTASPENNYGYGAPSNGYGQQGYQQPGGYESYPQAGCQTGGCNTGYGAAGCSTPYGACDTSGCGGMSACISKHAGGGYWFGGVYGLYMDRDNSNKYPLAFTVPTSMPDGYPPTDMNVVMTSRDVDVGFQPGVEFRLGRAFGGCGSGCGGCDPCGGYGGGCGGCGAQWGIEGVYWTLFNDDAMTTYVSPAAPQRTYTMMPMYGLEYNGGAGYNPVNVYWDHGTPSVAANPYTVTAVRQRSSFEAQNLEVNMLRLNICGGGYGPAACSVATGASACGGGCDSGYGGCATGGCATGGCASASCCAPRGPRYSCTAVCGFRWMKFDEDFMFGVDYTGGSTGFLNYNANVENNLIGAQIGCNGMYRVGCKWGLHANTLVGIYGNDIDVRQYFQSPTGQIRYIGDPTNFFDVNASKTDVSMLGELRLGVSYQCTCHCRLYGGWRVLGITGLALATDQTPNAFLSEAQMASYVNSNGSMILHGLQTGVEWNY